MTEQRSRSRWSRGWEALALPALGGVFIIGIWWLSTIVFSIRTFFLPKPPEVVDAFMRIPGSLIKEAGYTLAATTLGFAAAAVGGVLVAIALTAWRPVERAIMPWLVAVNALPKVALAPLLVVWLGFDLRPKVMMAVLICFFPIVVSTMAGLTATPADLGELATSLSATGWQRFVKVRMPWALPQIFVGLKVTILLALVGAVVGENATPNRGLGAVIAAAGSSADTPLAFAALAMLCMMGIGLFYLVVGTEQLLLPWAREIAS